MIRPKRRRIMPRTAARASRNVAERLIAITCPSPRRAIARRDYLCHARIGDQNVELTHRLFGARHQGIRLGGVGEIAGQHVDALAEIGGKLVEDFAPGAGDATVAPCA